MLTWPDRSSLAANIQMQSTAVVALALLESVQAFQAPVMRSRTVQMFSEGDLGVLPPLGVYDPLGLIETRDIHRYHVDERAKRTPGDTGPGRCRRRKPSYPK